MLPSTTAARAGERLVDTWARRPAGRLGRALYRNPEAHESSFVLVMEWLGPLEGNRCLELGCGGGVRIPRPTDGFTAVFCANMFFFVDDPSAVLAEVARVLTPGGRVVIATLSGPLPKPSLKNWWTLPPLGPALQVNTDAQMRALYDAAGFVDVHVESFGGQQLSRGPLPAVG